MSVINFETDNKTYTLEFNRKSIVEMEKLGFSFKDLETKIVTNLTLMVYGALYKNHKSTLNVAEQVLDAMIDEYGLEEVMSNLSEMISDVFLSGDKKKKIVRQ